MSIPSPIVLYNLSDATMKGLLPAGYTPLAYIESSGTLYIDTGVLPDPSTTDYLLDFLSVPGDYVYLGASISSWETAFCISSGGNSGGNTNYYILHNGARSVCSLNGTARHFFCYFGTTANYDGNNKTISRTSLTINKNIYLFANNSNGSVGFKPPSMKCYSCRIWSGGSLVVDLRPCIQDSNGVIGMYDLVSRTFKTNSGSGTFIAGPPLAVGKGGGKSLPEEYLLVEYLESNGSSTSPYLQFTDRGLQANDILQIDASILRVDNNGQPSIFGWLSVAQIYFPNKVLSYWQTSYIQGSTPATGTTITLGTRYLFKSTIKNTLASWNLFTYTPNYYPANARIELVIISRSSSVIMHLFPCYRKSDMKPGMYDTVNGVFYTNAGSGEFILGPSITNCYTWEPNASSNGWEHWFDPTEYSIATATYNPLPKIKVTPGKTYVLEYDVKAASNYTPTLGAILLEWFTSTSAERTDCSWTGINIPLTTSYKRISYEWTCPSGQNYVDFGRRASENVAHTIKNITWREKNWKSPYPGLYTNVSSVYDSSKGWVADFNGSSSDIQSISNLSQLLSGNTYTISAWVLARSTGNYRGIAGPHLSNTHGFIFGQCSGSSNGISFNGISTTVILNTWIHFVLVNNNGSNSLYKNGELINSNPVSFSTTMLNKPIIVGRAFYGNDRYWDGEITNFLIFNVAFTAALVKELYGQ